MFKWAYSGLFLFGLGWLTGVGGTDLYLWTSGRHIVAATQAAVSVERRVTMYSKNDGSFIVSGDIRGVPQYFYVDTGATNVTLTYEHAIELGLRPESYEKTCFETTNGQSCGYAFVLDSMRIGEIQVDNLRVGILKPGAFTMNLLGMSFLSRLKRFEYRRADSSLTFIQ